MVQIAEHAIVRYIERVDQAAARLEAEEALRSHARAINAAAAMGATVVRLGCGARLIIREDVVVTVLEDHGRLTGHGERLGIAA